MGDGFALPLVVLGGVLLGFVFGVVAMTIDRHMAEMEFRDTILYWSTRANYLEQELRAERAETAFRRAVAVVYDWEAEGAL